MTIWLILATWLGAEVPAKVVDYTLALATQPEAVKVGESLRASLRIVPRPPWALKSTTPLEARLTATAGLQPAATSWSASDLQPGAEPGSGQLGIEMRAVAAGAQKLQAALTFFLCSDTVCQRYKDAVEAPIQVTSLTP